MIQLDAIHIEEFRGIRDLTLSLDGKSFVVWGPNGSGKSGVVDAIDFALTGDVARLAGTGSGGLSVLRHGPHVLRRDDPMAAKVSVALRDTLTGESAVLTRVVKTAKAYVLDPDSPGLRAALERAQQHPELILSRREIIKYIVTEPGARAQEVQALLKLDRLSELRSLLRTAQSKTTAAERAALATVDTETAAVRRHLDLPSLLAADLIAAINKRRTVLGLSEIASLHSETDLSAGIDIAAAGTAFNKLSAVSDVQALREWVMDPSDLAGPVAALGTAIEGLREDPSILTALQVRSLVEAGQGLVGGAACPLCDAPWGSEEELRSHLAEKMTRSDAAAALQQRIEAASQAVARRLRRLQGLIGPVVSHASDGPPMLRDVLGSWSERLAIGLAQLDTVDPAHGKDPLWDPDGVAAPPSLASDLESLLGDLDDKPDQSATTSARTFLTIAQERWVRLWQARAVWAKANAAKTTASVIYQTYCAASDEALTALYEAVERDFSDYYRRINMDDESAFKAQLEPSAGKLDLTVDFYGIGMFPPGAYHSEGHQDGMGVCLYLALVKQLLGDEFRFAVMDDVVMSVDSNHRRQFCELLKDCFPAVQFVITTHDEIWARQMQSSGLVTKAAQARFHGWTVAHGPAHEPGHDFLDKIDADLAADDVPAAAHRLRRNLESIMTELATSLRGHVAYRPDANYELGELFRAVSGSHGKLLAAAAKSANSWSNPEAKARVEALKAARSAAIVAQQDENWAVNSAVHFNEWASMTKADFLPVLAAWKNFLMLFSCTNASCESWIYVVGQHGHEEALRCGCGAYDLNLRTKF